MRSYDFIAVLSPKKGDREGLAAVKGILDKHSVRINKEEKWGEKRLPHPNRKDITKGFFVYKKCKINPEKIKDLSRDIHLDSHVLRFMFKRLN